MPRRVGGIDLKSVAGPLDRRGGLAELGQHQRQIRLIDGARWIESDGPMELGGASRGLAQARVLGAQISMRLGVLGSQATAFSSCAAAPR